MKKHKANPTPATAQITAALKRASVQAHRRAKAYGTEALIAPLPTKRVKLSLVTI